MRILLIFTLISFITGGGSSIVTGYSNGTVIINCHYSKEQESSDKYFCMGRKYSWSCEDNIKTGIKNSWHHNGRLSLYDDTKRNYFMVVIRRLTRQDKGIYWCGVENTVLDSNTKVELNVKEETCCEKSVQVTAYLGGEATIICNYPEDLKYNTKYFCKQSQDNKTCDDINSKQAVRFSLTDISTERRYTVTISNLNKHDTGTYWCGVNTSYIALFTKVQLVVTATQATFIRPGTTVATLLFVGVVVLLMLIIVIKDYRQRYKTTAVFSANTVNSDAVSNREGNPDDENGHVTVTVVFGKNCDPLYQILNTNTADQDSTYQTLNPNTANQDSTYQTLNPNTANQDSIYQTLNPNTADQDSTYQTLNSNTQTKIQLTRP